MSAILTGTDSATITRESFKRLRRDSDTLGRIRDIVTIWERSGIGDRYAPVALKLLKQALDTET